ncbi:hypothetical protein [Prevotella denticola]|nr:hypothetical protein [Prevotella denticola]
MGLTPVWKPYPQTAASTARLLHGRPGVAASFPQFPHRHGQPAFGYGFPQ